MGRAIFGGFRCSGVVRRLTTLRIIERCLKIFLRRDLGLQIGIEIPLCTYSERIRLLHRQ